MKRILLIISVLSCSVTSVFGQLISVKADASPIFPHVFEEKTKVVKYVGPYSILYFDSLDTTYMCEIRDFNYYILNYTLMSRWRLPFQAKISDMYTPNNSYVWYGGKDFFGGNGIYGWMSPSNSFYPATSLVRACSLYDMDELKEIAVINNGSGIPDFRMFAIGSTLQDHNTHVIDLGDPTLYTLSYNYATVNSYEYLDNLEIVEGHVVFTTRDIVSNSVYINLRVLDVLNGLSNSLIDAKWRFILPTNEDVYGNVYIEYLEEGCFEVCYIKYNYNDGYVLCLHRINLDDMMAGVNNSIISQEISIKKGEFIQDIVYDSVEKVLIVMMDKDKNHSVFLHTVPKKTVNYPVIRLESDYGDRYFSIDTMASYSYSPGRMYQAWGGTKCFEQRFATEGLVLDSCIPFEEVKAICVDPVRIEEINDPLTRSVGTRSLNWDYKDTETGGVYSNCFIEEVKTINE